MALLRGGSYKAIHPEHFRDRVVELYAYWQQHNADKFEGSNVLIIQTPTANNNLRSSIGSIFHIWLFGSEFSNTTLVFTMNRIDIICKCVGDSYLFNVLSDAMDGLEKGIFTYTIGRGRDGIQEMNNVFGRIRPQLQEVRVGYITEGDTGNVSIFNNWYMETRPAYLECQDVTNGFLELFTLKNKTERANLRRSGNLNHKVMDRYVVGIIRFIVQNQMDFRNSEISRTIKEIILNSWKVNELKHERVDICYPPIVQSGHEFDLRPYTVANDNILFYGSHGVIICGIGSSYDDCCTYLARTYLISPSKRQKEVYEILKKAQKFAISALRPDIKVSEVYEKARYMVKLHDHNLVRHLTQSAGSGIGISFYESILDVNPNNEMIIRKWMVFNISIGFEDVIDAENKFSMLLGDTIIVEDDGPRILTLSKKSFDFVRII